MQRVAGHASVDEGPQAVRGAAQLVVLLGGLDDGREVEPTKTLELLGLARDVVELGQHVLEEALLLGLAGRGYGHGLQLLLACRCAVAQPLRHVLDEVVHAFELHVGQLVDKGALVVGRPAVVVLVILEQLLELVVVDVLVLPGRIHALAQGSAKLHRAHGSNGATKNNRTAAGCCWRTAARGQCPANGQARVAPAVERTASWHSTASLPA